MLSLTYFREEWFTQSNTGLWLYRVLAMGGLFLLAAVTGRLFSKKWMWAFLIFLWMGEIGFATLFKMSTNGKKIPETSIEIPGTFFCVSASVTDYFSFKLNRIFFSRSATVSLKIMSVSRRSCTALQE